MLLMAVAVIEASWMPLYEFCCAVQELAQRALVAYVRSIFLQPNKAVFDASALPAAEFALSMGLTSVPKLRFLKRHGPKKATKEAGTSPGMDSSFVASGCVALPQGCSNPVYGLCSPVHVMVKRAEGLAGDTNTMVDTLSNCLKQQR